MIPSRILVTGAEGFVGHHLLASLRMAFPRARLIAAVRQGSGCLPAPGGSDAVIAFDLLSATSMAALVEAARPEACVHLAAFSDVGASFADPDAAWAVNVDGTRLLANTLLARFPNCVLLHVGSADIYGLSFQSGVMLDEQAAVRPANPYAASKAAADLALGEMALRGLAVVRMRPLNHIGPGQSERFAVASLARQVTRIAAGLQPPVIQAGALHSSRMFLDVRDVCLAYVAVLQAAPALPAGAVFNVGAEAARSIGDVLHDLLELAGVTATVETNPSVIRPLDIPSTRCSSAALCAAVGWRPTWRWEATLREILTYWARQLPAAAD